jgi:hypothetical protein
MDLNGFSPNTNRVKDDLSLASLSRKLDEINLPKKEILKTALTKLKMN